ncbi:MAG: hypothetical protein LUG46_03320 [Erysipelotrichaceae bacterium]|nr:hypothetical protein [Erysipelotrichaceae bacterium]
MNKKEYDSFVQQKKETMHYEEMCEEDKVKFDEQHEIEEDDERIEYTDSKREGDYIDEDDLDVDNAL